LAKHLLKSIVSFHIEYRVTIIVSNTVVNVADGAGCDLINDDEFTYTLPMPCFGAGTGLNLFLIEQDFVLDHHLLLCTAIATTESVLSFHWLHFQILSGKMIWISFSILKVISL
jgi:hypothetical protein